MASPPSETPRSTATVKDFAYALGRHLPRRLSQLRQLGKQTRALGRSKPKR